MLASVLGVAYVDLIDRTFAVRALSRALERSEISHGANDHPMTEALPQPAVRLIAWWDWKVMHGTVCPSARRREESRRSRL